MIPAHIYYPLTFLSVNNPPPVQASLAVCYFSCGSDNLSAAFCRTDDRLRERKANETRYPCLWLFHRRRRERKITLALTLNESIKLQRMHKKSVSLYLLCLLPVRCHYSALLTQDLHYSPVMVQGLLQRDSESSFECSVMQCHD